MGDGTTAAEFLAELKEEVPLATASLAALHGAGRQVHLMGGDSQAKILAKERLQRNISYTMELFGPYELFLESMKEFTAFDGEGEAEESDEDDGDLVMADATHATEENGATVRERRIKFALLKKARKDAAQHRLLNLKEVLGRISSLADRRSSTEATEEREKVFLRL